MAARQEPDGPAAPRLTTVRPGPLAPVAAAEVCDGDVDLDGVVIEGLRADDLVWTGRRRLGSSRVDGLAVGSWEAAGCSFVDAILDGVEVSALGAPGSSWWNVEISGSRIGSAELYDTTWRSVRFSRCKLGYLNLRGAKLTDVVFADCIVEELDLARSTASRVAFPGTRLNKVEFSGSKLTDVDLRSARLEDVGDLEGLRGASITVDQLLDLAPGLAARLGIRVE